MMNDWHDNGWAPGTWVAMGLTMLAFWGLIAVLVVYAIHHLGHRPANPINAAGAPADQARQGLDERFARGEIDTDEYNRRRDVLRSP